MNLGDYMERYKDESGLTLIEILLSIVLISIIALAFSGAFISGIRSQAAMENRLEVINLSESLMEIIESDPSYYTDVYKFSENFNGHNLEITNLINSKSSEIKDFDNFYIENLGEVSGVDDLYEFEVTVSWDNKEYSLKSRILIPEM